MGKGLAIMGIVASVAATLTILVLVSAAVFMVIPALLAGVIVLALQRTLVTTVGSVVVLLLTVLATLGLMGSVTTEDGGADFGIGEGTGRLLAVLGLLAVPVAAVALNWNVLEPRWMSYVGVAAAGLTALAILVNPGYLITDDLEAEYDSGVLAVIVGLLPLAAIVPMVGLLRGGEASPAGEGASP